MKKIILFIFLILCLSGFVNAIDGDILFMWDFENGTNGNDITGWGSVGSPVLKYRNSLINGTMMAESNHTSTTSSVSKDYASQTSDTTISFWVRSPTTSTAMGIFISDTDGGSNEYTNSHFLKCTSGTWQIYDGSTNQDSSVSCTNNVNYYMEWLIHDFGVDSKSDLKINGNLVLSDITDRGTVDDISKISFTGFLNPGTIYFDNVCIQKGTWYSTCFDDTNNAPIVVLKTPTYNDHLNDNPVRLIYNITDADDDLLNCTLKQNGSLKQTLTNVNITTNPNWDYNLTVGEGNIGWVVNCTDGTDFGFDNSSFIVDRTSPDWTIRTINTDNTTIIDRGETSFIYFNDTVDDTYLFAYNVTVKYPNGTIWFSNQTINLNESDFNYTYNITITDNEPNGTYSVNYIAEDDHTANIIPTYTHGIYEDGLKFFFDDYDITIKTDNPQTLETVSTTKLIDRYTFNFDYKLPKNIRYYSLISDEIIYYRGGLYDFPVFVIGKNWVDFNIDDSGVNYRVIKKSDYWYQIEITTINPSISQDIHSLGGLNIVNETYLFEIKENFAPIIINTTPTQNFSIYDGSLINFTTNATDQDNDTLTYKYYYDSVLNHTGQNLTNFFIPYNSHGLHNMTVIVSDGGKEDNFTWHINITHSNLAPNTTSISRSPLTSWYSNIANTYFSCTGFDGDNETQPENWTVEMDYRTSIIWTSLTSEFLTNHTWKANISISALEGETLDVRCRISDGEDFSDYLQSNNIVTILEAYTSIGNVTSITPSNTVRDLVTSVTCSADTYGTIESYKLRYDIDYYYNNSWNNLSYNFFNKALFDMAKIDYGENVSFRCRINDSISTTEFVNGSDVTREHITNLIMFDKGNDGIIKHHRQYYKGIYADFFNEINVSIISSFADCNGDGFFDYYFTYTDGRNTTTENFLCYNNKGIKKHTVGVFINKTNGNNSLCGYGITGICKIERIYDVVVK